MNRSQPVSTTLTAREAVERHNRVLLHAFQTAHPVMYCGCERYIHTLKFQQFGGGTDTTVFLTGKVEPVPADELTLPLHHSTTEPGAKAPERIA